MEEKTKLFLFPFLSQTDPRRIFKFIKIALKNCEGCVLGIRIEKIER